MSEFPKIDQVNEITLIVYFSDVIDLDVPPKIASIIEKIKHWPENSIIDVTPSYTSLLVNFNPISIQFDELKAKLSQVIDENKGEDIAKPSRLVEIPVYYSPESGLDLEETAALVDISVEELIELHSESEYTVFALGFMPGFAFMGIVPPLLVLPRLSTPRANVPPGSVAIAEKQTAVYPDSTPGGWRLLGRSPMKLFDPDLNPPQPYQIGDRIKFIPIDRNDYLAKGGNF